MTKEEALKTLEDLKNSPNMVKHALACGFVMRTLCHHLSSQSSDLPSEALAKEESFDLDDWEIVGLLHDGDYEQTKTDMKSHSIVMASWVRELGETDEVLLHGIESHGASHLGVEPTNLMEWCLFCSDELTGLIVATVLVQPEKKLGLVTVVKVLDKFKSKNFAAGAKREDIVKCEEKLGLKLPEFTEIVLKDLDWELFDELEKFEGSSKESAGKLEDIVKEIIKNNPKAVADYKGGKTSTMGFLVGQVMQSTKGSANPNEAKNILEKLLK